jgi:hypothetical protein
MELKVRSLRWSILAIVLVAACGCRAPVVGDLFSLGKELTFDDMARIRPRTRVGSFASSTLTTTFLSCSRLGKHSYRYNVIEKNGVVYTCSGGHLDIAHLRNAADWTAHLAALTYYRMKEGAEQFSFDLDEDATCWVEIVYPDDWNRREDVEKAIILYDVAAGLGQYFAYHASMWHEIATWFGYKMTGFYPEFGSAFSWEDMYSNLLGCHVGYLALYDNEHSFDRAVTVALEAELAKLGPQPKSAARGAADLVRGDWFVGEQPVVIMKGRNFDVGLDDGEITPWLVPHMPLCLDAKPQPYAVPDLDFLKEYGFAVRFEIELRLWEKNRILAILYPDGERGKRFNPAAQLPVLMDYIERDAVRRYGENIALHTATSESTTR